MTKEEFFALLRANYSYNSTQAAVREMDENVDWSNEEVAELCDIALACNQVYGTLTYTRYPLVRNFYRKLLSNYRGDETENIKKIQEVVYRIGNEQIYSFLIGERNCRFLFGNRTWHDAETGVAIPLCDGLYHANSVSTSISYIRHKMIYSRQYGDRVFTEEQTEQWSDETDVSDGVYNDLFFDNCDIRAMTGKHSAYGPITFVFDEIILRNSELDVKITKANPVNVDDFGAMNFEDKYFTSLQELEEVASNAVFPFRTNFGYHTTIRNQEYLPLEKYKLKYILVERNQVEEVSQRVKECLINELHRAGLGEIPVIIRPDVADVESINTSAPLEVLWRILH